MTHIFPSAFDDRISDPLTNRGAGDRRTTHFARQESRCQDSYPSLNPSTNTLRADERPAS